MTAPPPAVAAMPSAAASQLKDCCLLASSSALSRQNHHLPSPVPLPSRNGSFEGAHSPTDATFPRPLIPLPRPIKEGTQELDHPSLNLFPSLNPSLPTSNTIADELDSPSFFLFAVGPIPQLQRPVVPLEGPPQPPPPLYAFAVSPPGWSRSGA
jgi:hypothetical protein